MKTLLFLIIFISFSFLTGCKPAQNANFGSLGRTPTFINPSLTINSSSFINSSNQSSFTFSGTCSGNGQTVELTGMITESPICAFGVWTITKDLSLLGEATHTLQANHQHTDGKKAATITQNIIKDTIAPALSFTAPTAGGIINNANKTNFLLSGTCGDNGQVINIFSTPSGISTTSTCIAGAWTKVINASTVPDGALHIYAIVSDLAGNTNLQDTGGLTKITTVPTITLTAPINGSYVNASQQANMTINGSCSENGQNVIITSSPVGINSNTLCSSNSWSTTLNLSALSEGNITFTINHSSVAGNTASPVSTIIIKDTIAPSIIGLVNDATPSATKIWNWSCSETCSYRYIVDNNPTTTPTGTYSSVTTASLSDNGGTAYIHVQGKDLAGNESPISDASAIMSYTRVKGILSGKLYEALGLTIQNTITGESLSLEDNGNFQFSSWTGEASYNVIITNQPTNHTCSISSNTGALPNASAISVVINCTPHTYTIGGNITGLTTGATLTILGNSNTGSTTNTITLSNEENSFTMPEPRYAGRMYYLKVESSSANVTCRLDPSKKEGVLNANLTDANITCVPRTPGNCDNQSAELPTQMGSISSVVCDGNDKLYMGGSFSGFGNSTGGALSVNSLDTSKLSYAHFAIPDGSVYTAISDNHGGWYIGGTFQNIGRTPRKAIGHIFSDGSLNPSFNPGMVNTSTIKSLVLNNSKLYVVGDFDSLGDAIRYSIARIHPITGLADSWNPTGTGITNLDTIDTLLIDGDELFVAGNFAKKLIKISISTGITNPSWTPSPNGSIYALARKDNTLFVGGSFTIIGPYSLANLAAISTIDGSVNTAWTPNPNSAVLSLGINLENLFVGGSFSTIGGQSRQYLAKLSIETGQADPSWSLSLSGGYVNTISLNGNDVYIGGSFNGPLPTPAYIAKISTATTTASSSTSFVNKYVRTIAQSGNQLFVGGDFREAVQTTAIKNLARISTTTGAIDSWNPEPNNSVNKVLLDGINVYTTGLFTSIKGTSGYSYLARISTITGEADTTWKPQFGSYLNDILSDNGYLYVAGSFSSAAGSSSHKYLRRISISTGLLDTSWQPILNQGTSKLKSTGGYIYAAGYFTSINSYPRSYIARFDTTTGSLDSWAPSITGGALSDFSVDNNYAYVGGSFTGINGYSHNYIGRISIADGLTDSWPTSFPNNTIQKLEQDTESIYIAGSFTWIGGKYMDKIAKINISSGALDPLWNPYLNLKGASSTLEIFPMGTDIIFGGLGSTLKGGLINTPSTGSGTYPY